MGNEITVEKINPPLGSTRSALHRRRHHPHQEHEGRGQADQDAEDQRGEDELPAAHQEVTERPRRGKPKSRPTTPQPLTGGMEIPRRKESADSWQKL